MSSDYVLIKKLDEFIRKYYKNRLIKGLLLAFSLLAIYYLILIISEYFFYFNKVVRTALFLTFFLSALFLFARLILIPILQLIRIGKIISYFQAAEIIGTHFPEIQDKLLNTLQLIKTSENDEGHSDLLAASIEQKTLTLKVFRFTRVIDFRKNIRFLRFALVPVVIFILLAILSPKIISDPTSRLLQFNNTFIRPDPFKFEILNRTLSAVQQDDFELIIEAKGNEIPSEVFIETRDFKYKTLKAKGFVFKHLFKSVQGNISFWIVAGNYTSQRHEILVFPKPMLLGFEVKAEYPTYINRVSEKTENIGDIVIPEGSRITWTFDTKDVNRLKLRLGDKRVSLKDKHKNIFTYSESNPKTMSYCISPVNENILNPDSVVFNINVIKDGFPTIFVTESRDSTFKTTFFYNGTIKDDYGFSRLTFNYSHIPGDDFEKEQIISEEIPLEKGNSYQVFYYAIDLLKLMPVAGMNVRYFFEIWDNDGINGAKSTRSELKSISTSTLEEIIQLTNINEKIIGEEIERSLNESKSIQTTIEDLKRKLIDQNSITFQEIRKLEELVKTNLFIEEKVKDVIGKLRNNIEKDENYLKASERIIEKQKQLNELMDQLLSDELKKIVEEIRDLLKQFDKAKLGPLMEKMKMSNKDLEIQLDRNLALMKQIEFERKLETLCNDLRKTADKQEALAEETIGQQTNNDQLIEKQNRINDKADTLSERIRQLKKEGQQLETPADLGKTEGKQDSIHKNLIESKEYIEDNMNSDAFRSQKTAAKQMKELAKQMEDSQLENEEEQLGEDASNIRMILENLVRLSFEQEGLMGNTRIIARSDPRYPGIVVKQREFADKMNVIEDSLNSIAKRQIIMKPFVTKEISAIRLNNGLALEAMDNRNINLAVSKQQYVMTSINNLAVMLGESLENMNQEIAAGKQSKGGKKSCKNPSNNGGKMSMGRMKKIQDMIGQQLKILKSGMEAKPGKDGGTKAQKSAISKQIANLVAQQEALRNEMQGYQREIGGDDLNDQKALNETVREMEQIERDLINKSIGEETFRKQQNIMTRLLESERAEQKREQEEKRESAEAKYQKFSNPEQNFQYNIKKKTGLDNIQLTLPVVSSFYKGIISSYILKIGY
ncbi:MAG: hypothetical protein WCK84_09020 [Bacteroidota bacterium]